MAKGQYWLAACPLQNPYSLWLFRYCLGVYVGSHKCFKKSHHHLRPTDAKNKNTTEQTKQNSCFQSSYFSVRIFTTSEPISNPLKTFAKLFNANFSFQYHHALLYRYLPVLILFCSILPHPTLSYPILSFLFYFFCIILSDPRLSDSLQLIQQPQKLWAIMKR